MFKEKRIHCVGVGGIGLSALAQYFVSEGYEVSGCDKEQGEWLKTLEKRGVKISVPHNANHVNEADLIIHTLALPHDHEELVAAKRKNIPILNYPQALGQVIKDFRVVAMCGSHGKTTVTCMIAKILIENDKDPNVIVGTQAFELGNNNFRKGKSDFFVIEACEYQHAFLEYSPDIILITNIDHDHFDTYPEAKDFYQAFYDFTKRLKPNGIVIGNYDDSTTVTLFERLLQEGFPKTKLLSFAIKNRKADIVYRPGMFRLEVPGIHNISNALGAYAVAKHLGINETDILYSLNRYEGSGRRLEEKGIIRGVRIIDDYAHHPSEIRASIQALREKYPKEKIWIVYQPHQFIRTKALLNEFGPAFQGVERVIVPNIYDARDFGTKGSVTVDDLVAAMAKYLPSVSNGSGFEKTAEFLKKHWTDFNILITMGAGDVWKIQKIL